MSKFRDFTKFRWRSDFHLVLWEILKQSYPDLPKWTYTQLRENGWWLAAGKRGYINLMHTDGTIQEFLMNIQGQDHPHMSAMWGNLLGIDINNNEPDDLVEFHKYVTNNFSHIRGFSATIASDKTVNITISWDAMQKLFDSVGHTPLNESEPDPRLTTSEYFVKEILNHTGRRSRVYTYLPK